MNSAFSLEQAAILSRASGIRKYLKHPHIGEAYPLQAISTEQYDDAKLPAIGYGYHLSLTCV